MRRFDGLTRILTRFLVVVVATSALVGCGGGGGKSSSRSTAAAISSAVPNLPAARAEHTATLLRSGEVLVAGGVDITGAPVKSTFIISTTAVRSGPDLTEARVGHSATLLTTGEVLIAGGSSDVAGTTVLGSTELFDPVTSTVTAGPTLAQARAHHAAGSFITAQGEQVLIAGGFSGQTQTGPTLLDSAEVLDVALGASNPIAARLTAPAADPRMARLDTGGLLVVSAAGAQVFEPQTGAFRATNVVVARDGAAVVSRGREVLVAGGESATGIEDSTEVYDSITNTFAQGVRLGERRRDAAVAAVGSNDVVIVGGRDGAGVADAVEVLNGATFGQSRLTARAPLSIARDAHTATAISTSKLIVVGGYDAQGLPLASVETIDLAAQVSSASTTAAGVSPTPTTLRPTTPTTTPPPATTPPAPSTGSGSSGGLSGLLGSLFGGGSSSGSTGGSGSFSSTLLNAALNAAVSALTSSSGTGFSGFMSAFVQNLVQNLLGGLLGGSGSTSGAGGSGLSGLLSSLLGGSSSGSGSSSGGISSLLSSLLGSLTGGSSSGSSGGLSSLLSGLFGGGSSSGSTSGSSGGLSGLLSSLFGGGSSGSGSGSTSSGSTSTAPSVVSMTPGQGRVGDTVTIVVTNYGTTVGVSFNGRAATISSANASNGRVTIVCTVPAGATTGNVTVRTNNQTASAGNFTVL